MEGVFMNPRHHGNQQTTGITSAGLSIKEMYWKDVGEHIEFPRGFEKHTQKISRNHRTLVGQEHSENHAIVPLLSHGSHRGWPWTLKMATGTLVQAPLRIWTCTLLVPT